MNKKWRIWSGIELTPWKNSVSNFDVDFDQFESISEKYISIDLNQFWENSFWSKMGTWNRWLKNQFCPCDRFLINFYEIFRGFSHVSTDFCTPA